ncbi:MAG: ferritin family protein [Acidobacteriota bacterium]
MNVEESIVTALEYEQKVRDHYLWAARESKDPKGKAFFETLAREEQGHVDFLGSRLEEWRKSGVLSDQPLETTLPSKDFVEAGAKVLASSQGTRDYQDDYRRLFTALKLEEEVSQFYKGLVASLEDPRAKAMYQRFLEIEDGHTAIVQAETDVLTRTGYFFEFQEFNLEE